MNKIQEQYKDADLNNIETLKQIIINTFTENNFLIRKIKKGKVIGKNGIPDTIYVYHCYAPVYYQNKREFVKQEGCQYFYRRLKIPYQVNAIPIDDIDCFFNSLKIVIHEAKIRRGDKK